VTSLLIPLSLLLAGTVFTAGHATFRHFSDEAAVWRATVRSGVRLGLLAVLISSDSVIWTALWLGLLPSVGLASHVWFCHKHRLAC
jgi:hypothetical protein